MSGENRYLLEVYEPGSTTTPLGCWPAAQPLHMAVGDLVHAGLIDPNALPSATLRVVGVEHALWLRDGLLAHKLMVFTAAE